MEPKTSRGQLAVSPKELVTFGKYLFLGKIGKGGMADVFLARPKAQKRLVAIKVILEALAKKKQYVDMFIQEGKLAVQLNHDAIVKTYEIGKIHGRHFICMEYISGVDLSLVMRQCRAAGARLPVPHALSIALRICEGLHYAHELTDGDGKSINVVNRDVSPSNVRISFEGEVKQLDFGIAKATSSLSSEIGVLKGKFSHMSPEQVRGLPLDRRSDVFSVGIVLHEMLTLEKLFRGDSDFQMMDLVRRAEIRPPSAINPRVHDEVDQLVLRALEKEPKDRFQSAEEMAQELRVALARYNFRKSELKDLVRDLCRDEWVNEQKTIETSLSGETIDLDGGPNSDEDYGVLLEVSMDGDASEAEPEVSVGATPKWMFILLAAAVGLLALAVALLMLL